MWNAPMKMTAESHYSERAGWLRAAVLGADDGIVSTASLMVGVAASAASFGTIILAGVAGLVAGAMSMAAGEYVSVASQLDVEKADIAREKHELTADPEGELRELELIYRQRGLNNQLAKAVAMELSAGDRLTAHLRDELGIESARMARPIQAGVVSAASFGAGASLPILAATLHWGPPAARISVAAIAALAMLGAVGARAGGASMGRGLVRVLLGGAAAMAVTALIGRVIGTVIA